MGMTCGLCKQPIRGDERYVVDHYKCSADLHQSFRDDIADLLALARAVASHFGDTDAPLGLRAAELVAKSEGRMEVPRV